MKKTLFMTTLLIILVGILPLMAQENTAETYALTVSLEKVYPYRKGYIVKYRKGISQMVDAYLPYEWFKKPDAKSAEPPKGELILMGSGSDWPHLTIFYKNGAFDHLRLYVRKERSHETWGSVPLEVNIDDRFENVEGITLEF
ncbi:hypothetical protein AGMMS49940_02150 [Spirochaetia bacterium]|nr:hypothetical protein AGMMS49940_02150 [Spirochaetia bacterium]